MRYSNDVTKVMDRLLTEYADNPDLSYAQLEQFAQEAINKVASRRVVEAAAFSRYQEVCSALMLQHDLADSGKRELIHAEPRTSDGEQYPITVTRDGDTYEVPADHFRPERENVSMRDVRRAEVAQAEARKLAKLAAMGNQSEVD